MRAVRCGIPGQLLHLSMYRLGFGLQVSLFNPRMPTYSIGIVLAKNQMSDRGMASFSETPDFS